MTEVHICTGNNSGGIKGFYFTLSDPDDSDSETFDTPAMGKTTESSSISCTSFDMTDYDFEWIGADLNNHGEVKALAFDYELHDSVWGIYDEWDIVYGNLGLLSHTSWEFNPTNPVIAPYGKINEDDNITQLGWVTLDTDC